MKIEVCSASYIGALWGFYKGYVKNSGFGVWGVLGAIPYKQNLIKEWHKSSVELFCFILD